MEKPFWSTWSENNGKPRKHFQSSGVGLRERVQKCTANSRRAKVSHKRVFGLLRGDKPQLEMAEVLQKPSWEIDFIQCGCWEELCSPYAGAKPQPNTG